MKGIKRNSMWKALWILPAIAGGLVFLWLFPLKLLARLAARLGHSSPCPAALSWLVDNSLRRTYMRPVLDRIGIRAGERVLELGPGPGGPDPKKLDQEVL
jgi:hypothetical protein